MGRVLLPFPAKKSHFQFLSDSCSVPTTPSRAREVSPQPLPLPLQVTRTFQHRSFLLTLDFQLSSHAGKNKREGILQVEQLLQGWGRSLCWQNELETSAQRVGLKQREHIPRRAQILKIFIRILTIPFLSQIFFFSCFTLSLFALSSKVKRVEKNPTFFFFPNSLFFLALRFLFFQSSTNIRSGFHWFHFAMREQSNSS